MAESSMIVIAVPYKMTGAASRRSPFFPDSGDDAVAR